MKYSNQSDDFYERPAIGRFFFFPKGALTHHREAAVVRSCGGQESMIAMTKGGDVS